MLTVHGENQALRLRAQRLCVALQYIHGPQRGYRTLRLGYLEPLGKPTGRKATRRERGSLKPPTNELSASQARISSKNLPIQMYACVCAYVYVYV